MSLLFLLLIGAAVYVLWFHKFTMPDGTKVKGWLAKNKAEKDSLFNSPNAGTNEKVNGVGLNIHSTKADFDRALNQILPDIRQNNDGWGNKLKAYFGWLMLATSRADELSNENVWEIMSDGYVRVKDEFQKMMEEKLARQTPNFPIDPVQVGIWSANLALTEGFTLFYQKAQECFGEARWKTMSTSIDAWYNDVHTDFKMDEEPDMPNLPCSAPYLVRLYTILQGQDDTMIEKNTEMFKEKYHFNFF